MYLTILYVSIFFSIGFGQECTNSSTWKCKDFYYNFVSHHGENLEEALQCIKYDKFRAPFDGKEKYTHPAHINTKVHLKKLIALNVEYLVSIN